MRQEPASEEKSVGIWIRVSTEDQVRGESPEHHEERARAYAKLKGWQVAEVYRLDAVSGKAVMAHPIAKRMLADIRSGAITGLVFSKLARLARNTKELLDFAEIFRACNADMISLAESIDTSTPAGRLFFTMIAAMAQWEREEIADRVKASIPIRAKLGKPIGGKAPFGYRWVDKRLEVDPETAPVRVLVHELFAELQRKKAVAKELNVRGYRTRAGGAFSDTAIARMLEDTTAKGLYRQNFTKPGTHGARGDYKPEDEWVWTPVEPIVTEALWERCAAILATQQQRKPAKRTRYLFSGLAVCECGPKMYVPARREKYVCPDCHNKMPVDDLEAVFRSELADFLLSPEELDAHHAAASELLREKQALIDVAEAELKKLTTAEDALFELYHAGQIAKGDFGRRHRPLSERRAQIENELPRLEADRDVLRIGMLSREEVLDEARDLSVRWPDLPWEHRRQIVETITEQIVIGKEGVEITLLQVPFGSDGEMATGPLGPGFRRDERVGGGFHPLVVFVFFVVENRGAGEPPPPLRGESAAPTAARAVPSGTAPAPPPGPGPSPPSPRPCPPPRPPA
jgi:site-specific DNA recombinase